MLSPRGTSVTPQLQHWMCTVLAVRALRVATVRQMYIRLSLGRQDTVWRGPESAPWMQLSNCLERRVDAHAPQLDLSTHLIQTARRCTQRVTPNMLP